MNAPDLDELVAEYQELCRKGNAPAAADFAAAHPQHAAELAELLPLVAALVQAGPTAEPSPLMSAAAVDMTLGDFHLTRRLGSGGMGAVYEAEQLSLQRRTAVKILSPDLVQDAASTAQFMRESQVIARLHHPHIVQVISAGQQDNCCYFAMDFIDGATTAQQPPRDPRQAAQWALQTARALAYAHSCGVVHLDIKPANLMRDAQGNVLVTDFGLAALAGEVPQGGTRAYMAPERLAGQPGTPACDQYALGVTLWEWLTGKRPPAAPLPLRGEHADLHAIINRALAARPERRYACMADMAADLEHFLNGEPVNAATRRTGAARALRLWARRQPALACACGAAVLGVIGFMVALAVGWSRTDAALQVAENNAAVAEQTLNRVFRYVSAQPPTQEGSTLLKECLPYYKRLVSRRAAVSGQETQALATLARSARYSGDFVAAAEAYAVLARLTGQPQYLNHEAAALTAAGKTTEAHAVCRRLLAAFGASARPADKLECARALHTLGENRQAYDHVCALLQQDPQNHGALYLYATLTAQADFAPTAAHDLPAESPLTLLTRLTTAHPDIPEYGISMTELARTRLSQSRRFTPQDWAETDTAAALAMQLAGRYPNTPSVVTSVVHLLRAYSRAQYRRGNETAARRLTDRMLGMLELLFYNPQTPDSVRETLIEMQLERCAARPAQGAAEVLHSIEQELSFYHGPKAADYRARLEELKER